MLSIAIKGKGKYIRYRDVMLIRKLGKRIVRTNAAMKHKNAVNFAVSVFLEYSVYGGFGSGY
jgi:hypothetical protein